MARPFEVIGWAILLGYFVGWLTKEDEAGEASVVSPPGSADADAVPTPSPATGDTHEERVRVVTVKRHRRRVATGDPAPVTDSPASTPEPGEGT